MYIQTVAKGGRDKIDTELYYMRKKKTIKHESEQEIKPDFPWLESWVSCSGDPNLLQKWFILEGYTLGNGLEVYKWLG